MKALRAALTLLCLGLAAFCALMALGQEGMRPSTRIALVASAPRRDTPAPFADRVNVNTATHEELMALPGIGPDIAGSIVKARENNPFYFVEDLDQIPGIGAARVEMLRPLVRMH